METIGNLWLYVVFFGLVTVMLLVDFLGFKQKQNQDVPIKQAAYWSIAWVTVAVLFGGGLWLYLQQTVGLTLANSVHDKFHRALLLSGFFFLKIASTFLNSSFFPKPIKRRIAI
ncbi:integral membrane protein TerC [Acinetobacter baumannii]|uniref:Integral membrane protein TerC family protein n=1 Tax=Acinetobacter nosocomialis 28F TaxID=1147131 RepID=A0AA36P3B0_ACINO|nr:hypothetical protein HMPREF0014_03519 [Acinetobacter sp. RUH 2624]OIG80714.1 hypothetical protein A7M82_18090 [Acinetobacter baumannii]CDI28337.1 Integral membrane protein TerC family protein [Acinetobacter nosocomialis 28F]SSV75312.1 integral membrane protein TerC [Acinetobacter nosocomialis]SSR25015.1 integral membrane protein TerC [Acinetobacter baumannii]